MTPRRDWLGAGLLALTAAGLVLTMVQPPRLASDVTIGLAFVPVTGSSRWLAPVGLATIVLAGLLLARCLTAARPLVDVRRWAGAARQADLVGAALLALTSPG